MYATVSYIIIVYLLLQSLTFGDTKFTIWGIQTCICYWQIVILKNTKQTTFVQKCIWWFIFRTFQYKNACAKWHPKLLQGSSFRRTHYEICWSELGYSKSIFECYVPKMQMLRLVQIIIWEGQKWTFRCRFADSK